MQINEKKISHAIALYRSLSQSKTKFGSLKTCIIEDLFHFKVSSYNF